MPVILDTPDSLLTHTTTLQLLGYPDCPISTELLRIHEAPECAVLHGAIVQLPTRGSTL